MESLDNNVLLRQDALSCKMLETIDSTLALVHLTVMRNKETGAREFRDRLIRLSSMLAQNIGWSLPTEEAAVETPLAPYTGICLLGKVVLAPILTAASPMEQPFWDAIPNACSAYHAWYYRDELNNSAPVLRHHNLPQAMDPNDTVIVLDPMLATGGTLTNYVSLLKSHGSKSIIYAGLIGAPQGVVTFNRAHPDVQIHLVELDDHLDANNYIVRGLGDAGDRVHGRN